MSLANRLSLTLDKEGPRSRTIRQVDEAEGETLGSMYRRDPLALQLKAARRKIGRRVYFASSKIAVLFDGGETAA